MQTQGISGDFHKGSAGAQGRGFSGDFWNEVPWAVAAAMQRVGQLGDGTAQEDGAKRWVE